MVMIVPEDVPRHNTAIGADNLTPGGIISSKGYKTVREAFQEVSFKTMMLEYWKGQIETVQDGRYNGSKYAGSILRSAILEHPKILLEHEDFTNVKITPHFKEVQAIRLPFPKMVVVVGEPYDYIKRLIPEQHKMTADYGDGHLRHFYSFYASQVGDQVHIVVPMVDPKVSRATLVEIQMTYGETPTGEAKMAVWILPEQTAWIGQRDVDFVTRYLAEAIYMMTLNPATTQAYVSIPTKEEIEKNKKRINRNKKPLIEFKLITIDGKKPDPIKAPPLGTHASPRQHWRRGHWRHYTSGKSVFIDPMLVGDEKNGKIVKDYAVGLYDNAKNKRVQQGLQ
jgi:hypothetical protein